MQLEEYFQFLAPDDIRLKGSRIGIESVLYEYLHREQTPKAISERFPSLTLEQIYATLFYHHHYREKVEKYLADWLEYCRRSKEEQDRNPPAVIVRLRQLKADRARLQAIESEGDVKAAEELRSSG